MPPADDRLRFVIDTTAAFVLRDGPDFEQARLPGLPAVFSTQLLWRKHNSRHLKSECSTTLVSLE